MREFLNRYFNKLFNPIKENTNEDMGYNERAEIVKTTIEKFFRNKFGREVTVTIGRDVSIVTIAVFLPIELYVDPDREYGVILGYNRGHLDEFSESQSKFERLMSGFISTLLTNFELFRRYDIGQIIYDVNIGRVKSLLHEDSISGYVAPMTKFRILHVYEGTADKSWWIPVVGNSYMELYLGRFTDFDNIRNDELVLENLINLKRRLFNNG